jgi:hypothetical protein
VGGDRGRGARALVLIYVSSHYYICVLILVYIYYYILHIGWEEIVDEVTGDSFFVNHCTKTSSWLPPVHAAEDVEAAAWMQVAHVVC